MRALVKSRKTRTSTDPGVFEEQGRPEQVLGPLLSYTIRETAYNLSLTLGTENIIGTNTSLTRVTADNKQDKVQEIDLGSHLSAYVDWCMGVEAGSLSFSTRIALWEFNTD